MSIPPFFYRPPDITILNDSQFRLQQPLRYQWTESSGTYLITVPSWYVTDGASVPRVCWTLTGLLPTGVHFGAAVVHDYLYQRRGLLTDYELVMWNGDTWSQCYRHFSRDNCDNLFKRIMQDAGETPWKATAMFWAVRLFGGAAWAR